VYTNTNFVTNHGPSAVYLHPADKYHRLTRPTVKGTKSSMKEGSPGITAAL